MDEKLLSLGYQWEPSRYLPQLGYSRLSAVISGKPAQRYFDAKLLRVPTFDGRFFHHTQVSRHELALEEDFQVCMGRISLESYHGNALHAFSFGGALHAKIIDDDLFCTLTSDAPILTLSENPVSVGEVIADELLDLLAETQTKLVRHEDELYARISKHTPYELFLACMVTLQKRLDSIPTNLRRSNYRKVNTQIQNAIQIVRKTDGWDGHSPTLQELISNVS
jgi:hypothetical protein